MFSLILFSLSLCMYYYSLIFFIKNNSVFFEWEIIVLNSSVCVMSLLYDWMSLMFLGSVFIIASGVSKFSEYYMEGDNNFMRFMISLIFFVMSMVFLIVSPNLMSILLGWDGLGLTSYILVVYYQNENSCNAGMLTILSNRVGDVCILMSIGLMLFAGSWNFILSSYKFTVMFMLFVVLAGMTKSAQIPFSAWLPAAMAAPTPVSSLVHSSTLVTAGVYLLIRFYPLLENSVVLKGLLWVSILTMLMSGLSANFEMDMKKIIALSTLSQLGLMMMILSTGQPDLAFFHLITHAMFKSTLFMCSGVVIHMSNSSQDFRFMSGANSSSPFLMVVFSVTNLALMGFPFLAGFYSKDLILESFFMKNENLILLLLVILITGMTVSYSTRVMFMGMNKISNLKSVNNLESMSKVLIYSILILFIMSVMMGYFFSWGVCWNLSNSVLSYLSKYYILSISLVGLMIISSWYLSNYMNINNMDKKILLLMSKMWNLLFLSTKEGNNCLMKMSLFVSGLFDKGWIEMYGATGGKKVGLNLSNSLQMSQLSLMLKGYFLTIVFMILCMVLLYL